VSVAKAWNDLVIAGTTVEPGQQVETAIRVARLPGQGWLEVPLAVTHGVRPGPRVFVSAAIHGDELNGVETVRQVTHCLDAGRMSGSLVAVPVVNVFGLYAKSRYTPDRKDLNRMFPGSARGTIASRLAHLFMNEVVKGSTLGIDLHTGSDHRTNASQVRYDFRETRLDAVAEAFGAPLIIHKQAKPGTLRGAATKVDVPVLLWEAGEPMRFESRMVESGVEGVLRVMAHLEMIEERFEWPDPTPRRFEHTSWVRARRGGLFRSAVEAGQPVEKGDVIGHVGDALDAAGQPVKAPRGGVVIGAALSPVVFQGDPLAHLAW